MISPTPQDNGTAGGTEIQVAQLQYVNCQGKPLTVPPTEIDLRVRLAGLHGDLAEARRGFDASYSYSDDYTVYCRGRDQAARIAAVESQIAEVEERIA